MIVARPAYVVLMMVSVLFGLMSHCSCKDRANRSASPDPVRVAENTLQETLKSLEARPNPDENTRRRAESIRKALVILAGKSSADFDEPIFVWTEASAGDLGGGDVASSLIIEWIDPRLEVTGVYVVDRAGRQREFPNVIAYDNEDRARARITAWQQAGFPLVYDEETEAVWRKHPSIRPSLNLRPDELSPTSEVGLMLASGEKTKPMTLLVDIPPHSDTTARWTNKRDVDTKRDRSNYSKNTK